MIAEIKVNIGQFFGIEINDFAVSVAKTALWIAESQMMNASEQIIGATRDFLPLTTNANIVEGNALRVDWKDVVSPERVDYIMGNPPFVANTARTTDEEAHAKKMMTDEQSEDRYNLFGEKGGVLDYVACWYKKSALYITNTNIKCAFVSTDSITQGQQVEPLWSHLLTLNIKINFAYRSFKWRNDSNEKGATVYVIIIGFSCCESSCFIYDGALKRQVSHINPYLIDAPDILITSRKSPLCDVPGMKSGGKPVEGGFLIFNDTEMNDFIKKEPLSAKFFKRFTSGESFLYNTMQWCLWLNNATPKEINDMPFVRERVQKVKEFRLASKKAATQKGALTPHLFMEIKQPDDKYLLIPLTTSKNRKYIPIGFLNKDVIANNGASFVPSATMYHFGILESNVHMAWMKTVCGYFGPSYRYSNKIVYNNFPWPNPTPEQKAKIEQTAQAILDARANYPDSSLADLYDDLTMPPDLRKAHQENDKAVMQAYGFDWRNLTESDCVAALFKLYEELTANKA